MLLIFYVIVLTVFAAMAPRLRKAVNQLQQHMINSLARVYLKPVMLVQCFNFWYLLLG